MNEFTFGKAVRVRPAMTSSTMNSGAVNSGAMTSRAMTSRAMAPDDGGKPSDAAWIVLEAANDLGDNPTVEVCRRVIDASLNGLPATEADLQIILNYFR
jgi:hypothetical protein